MSALSLSAKSILPPRAGAGRFRPDLLYRLNVVTLRMPPLTERRDDIPLLFLQLVREAAARYRRDDVDVPPIVTSAVAGQDWPGNVRELRNAADRYVLGLSPGGEQSTERPNGAASLSDRVADFERTVISEVLTANGGKLKPVYESLGISRKTLYEKMVRYGLNRQTDEPNQPDMRSAGADG
jgi:two-component system C4-dicarboxylate transport response regulator DctD